MNRRITALMCAALLVPAIAAPQQPEIATTIAFTEGPTVDRDGNVYFTDLVFQRIMKLTPKGVLTVFREGSNNANGMLVDPQGRLWISLVQPYTYVHDAHGEKIRTVQFRAASTLSPSSLSFTNDGRVLVTPGCYEFAAR